MKDILKIIVTAAARIAAVVVVAAAIVVVAAGCQKTDRFLRVEPGSIDVPAEEVTEDVEVFIQTSAKAWMACMPEVEWLSFEYDEDRPDMVWVKVLSDNESLVARSAELTIIAGDGQSVVVPVTQSAMNVTLSVTPAALEPFSGNGLTTQTLTVETGKEWEAYSESGAEWLKITRSENGTGNVLTIGTEPMRSFDPRSDILIIRHMNEEFASLADSIPVVQNGVKLLANAEGASDSYEIEVSAAGEVISMAVRANSNWTATTEAPGVTLDPAGGVGNIEGEQLSVSVPANTSTEPLVFIVVFECEGEPYEYKFVQAGKEPEPEPEPDPDPDLEQNPPPTEP